MDLEVDGKAVRTLKTPKEQEAVSLRHQKSCIKLHNADAH